MMHTHTDTLTYRERQTHTHTHCHKSVNEHDELQQTGRLVRTCLLYDIMFTI